MGKKLKKNVPVLRFPEFVDVWEDKILGELSSVQTGPFGSQLKNGIPCHGREFTFLKD